MRNKTSPGEYLAFLSTKYEVDADSLFHALISAEENRKSKCGNLSIECRGKQRNKIILLITKDSKVVAQFPVSREFLLEQNNPIKDAQKADVLCRHLMKKDREPHSLQIKDLRIGMKKVSLKAEVLEIAKPMLVFTRFGNYATVTNALIADKTGQIKLCLWNEQIDSISIGETIQIENASISTFRGERQLRIGKKGILHSVESMIAN
jgi:replication factor A1